MNIMPAVAATPPINFRRSNLSEKFDLSFESTDIFLPPRYLLHLTDQIFQVSLCRAHIFELPRARNFSLDGIHRIRLAVKNQIGEIEVNALIVQTNVLNRAHERYWRFLAGLVTQVLPIALAVACYLTDRLHRLFIERVVGIFRNKSAMRLHGGDAALLGEVGGLLDVCDAGRACLARNQAYR